MHMYDHLDDDDPVLVKMRQLYKAMQAGAEKAAAAELERKAAAPPKSRVLLVGGNRCGRTTMMLAQVLLSKGVDVVCTDDLQVAERTLEEQRHDQPISLAVLEPFGGKSLTAMALRSLEMHVPKMELAPTNKPWYNKFRPKRGRY